MEHQRPCALQHNLVPRAFPFEIEAGQFQREKPWERGCSILGDLFRSSMAPLAQNVRQDSQIAPCNNNNRV